MEMEEAFEPRGSFDADANVVPSGEKASHRDLSFYGSALCRCFALAYNIIRAFATLKVWWGRCMWMLKTILLSNIASSAIGFQFQQMTI